MNGKQFLDGGKGKVSQLSTNVSVAKEFPGYRYICAKLEDFALSAAEEWLAIQCDYSC